MFADWMVTLPWPLLLGLMLLAVLGVVLGAAEALLTVREKRDGLTVVFTTEEDEGPDRNLPVATRPDPGIPEKKTGSPGCAMCRYEGDRCTRHGSAA